MSPAPEVTPVLVSASDPSPAPAAAPARPGRRLDSLTSLRFFAALVVFFVHAEGFTSGRVLDVVRWVSASGAVGVSFFFVLSGFVLTWVAVDGEAKGGVYRRRIARIYPAYAVALLAGALITVSEGKGLDLVRVLSTLTLLQAWVPDPDVYFAINGPSWTLSCEAFFYATFPLYAGRLLRASRRTRWVLMAVLVGAIGAVGVAFEAVAASGSSLVEEALWFVVHLPATRVLEFVLGALVAAQLRGGGLRRIRVGPAGALVVASYLALRLVPTGLGVATLTVVPFVVLIAAVAVRDRSGETGLLHHRWLVYLGQISFCFYLVHELVLRVLARWFANEPGLVGVGVVGLGLALSLAGAVALHHVVEAPAERRLRGAPMGRRARPADQLSLSTP